VQNVALHGDPGWCATVSPPGYTNVDDGFFMQPNSASSALRASGAHQDAGVLQVVQVVFAVHTPAKATRRSWERRIVVVMIVVVDGEGEMRWNAGELYRRRGGGRKGERSRSSFHSRHAAVCTVGGGACRLHKPHLTPGRALSRG
jgi:hypothetical protein